MEPAITCDFWHVKTPLIPRRELNGEGGHIRPLPFLTLGSQGPHGSYGSPEKAAEYGAAAQSLGGAVTVSWPVQDQVAPRHG